MATIVLKPGYDLDHLPATMTTPLIRQDRLVEGLARIVKEWKEAAHGSDLSDVQASVGLLLADVAALAGIPPAWIGL